MGHEFSGYTVGGIKKALTTLGYFDALLPDLQPETRETLAKATLFKFHPGVRMNDVLITLARQRGVDAVAAMMEEATRSSLGGIVAPLARMYLTLKGNEPSVLFERFNDLLRGTARGVTSKWISTGVREGRFEIHYVAPVNSVVVHGWRGAMTYVLEFCHARGDVKAEPSPPETKSVALLISWEAPRSA